MSQEIINRVAKSPLVVVDLEDYYPAGRRVQFDIADWLYEGLILREKDFRDHVANHDWSQYQGAFVAMYCSADAIIPGWAYLLLSVHLSPFARKVVVGDLVTLENILYAEIIADFDVSEYKDKPLIIKGCAHKPIPDTAFVLLAQKLQPVAKSIMYGEACSSVPLYKKPK